MDIHKPKAAHSIREFLIEIGTIICGILIALGLEQVLEFAHTEQQLHEAREALREEVRIDVAFQLSGVEADRCLDLALDRYAAWARGGPKPPRIRSGFPPVFSTNWDTVKVGVAPHMSLKERLGYARFYNLVAEEQWITNAQKSGFLGIVAFDEKATLDQAESKRLLEIIPQVRVMERTGLIMRHNLLALAKGVGVTPKKAEAEIFPCDKPFMPQ